MDSRNPVFSRTDEFKRGGYATFETPTPTPTADELQGMYSAPSATSLQTGRMTLDDVVTRTAMVFGLLVTTAAATYIALPVEQFGFVIVAMIAGLALGLVNSFRKSPSPALILAYAAVEGVFVGGISKYYEAAWPGIVSQAVLGTLAAFATMLALYKTRVIRATPKFQRILIIAGVGYLVFGLVHMVGLMFGLWPSLYTTGLLGVAVSVVGVVLASLYLVLDFDFVERGIRNGIPQQFAWTAAFALVVTLVWLYLEILRLLAVLNRNN